MARQKLHEALTTLHRELEQGTELTDEDRALLETVADDVQRTLDAEHDPDLGERLRGAALEFEARHPRTAQLFGEIADTLQRMGI